MFWKFPFIGWSRVHTGIEVVGNTLLVQEVWFNWVSRHQWVRKAIVPGFSVNALIQDPWFKENATNAAQPQEQE